MTACSSYRNQDLALPDLSQVSMVPPIEAICLLGRGLHTETLQPFEQDAEEDRRVDAVVGEGRKQFDGAHADDHPLLHSASRSQASLAEETDRPGRHPRAEKVLSVPLDHDETTAHVGANLVSDVPLDQNDPSPHAELASSVGGAHAMSGIPPDPDESSLHLDAEEVGRVPLDKNLAP